ncbi:MAG: hypothetical protein GY854_17160 [Deltaproteobacteria bacterium]|nr:hypothetical protein [Deltaproteobacteria bacterium]
MNMLDKVFECRVDIAARLNKAEENSTKEVVAAGEDVKAIVDNAKDNVQNTTNTIGRGLALMLETVNGYTEMTDTQLQTQSGNITSAMSMIKSIVRAGRNIKALAERARMLTLNARIVAASLGPQGAKVRVLANEIKGLSSEIESNTASISDISDELLKTLPQIVESAEDIREGSKNIIDNLATVETESNASFDEISESSSRTIATIMDLAYSALSHLQFHDPHIQYIQSIDTYMYQLEKDLVRLLDESREVEPPMLGLHRMHEIEESDDSDETLQEGEILMF